MKTVEFKRSLNIVLPCIGYGALSGALVGGFVFFFKYAAKLIEEFSRGIFSFARENLWFIPVVVAGAVLLALMEYFLHKKIPEVRGGGIPRTEGILRGMLSFKWLRTLLGTVVGSLVSFLGGLPLGSEGPAVLIGTSIGGMCGSHSSHGAAWQRHIMSGGAGAGFAVATGAPISGMLFVIEEVHKKFAPTLILMVSVSTICATIVNKILCSVFGISDRLFDFGLLPEFNIENIGFLIIMCLLVSFAVGAFDASISHISDITVKLKKLISRSVRLVLLFAIVSIFGIFYSEAVFSGHHVVSHLFLHNNAIGAVLILALVRMALLLFATDSGATGGIYIPTLTIGVLVSFIFSSLMTYIGMSSEFVPLLAVIGMCAFLGGTLRSPFVALVFFIEITEGLGNIFFAAVAIFVVNIVTTFFDKKPFYDRVLEGMERAEHEGKTLAVKFFEMKVSKDAFVIGKSVRDIMWPHASVIVSISRDHRNFSDTDLDGEKRLHEGDTLVLRARTYDEEILKSYLHDLVGFDYDIVVSEK